VNATVSGGKGRILNHSCHPNYKASVMQLADQQIISFYAIRNIKPHEELTFNYMMEVEQDRSKWEKCYCGAKHFTGYINYAEDADIRKRRPVVETELELLESD
jgi:SET domain-containing protein